MALLWSLHRFLVITSFFITILVVIVGAMYFGILNVYPVYSARYPSDVQIVLAVAINGVPFGGDKQV